MHLKIDKPTFTINKLFSYIKCFVFHTASSFAVYDVQIVLRVPGAIGVSTFCGH